MNFLRRLFGGQPTPVDQGLHLYVRCSHCGAPVHTRINLYNDLAVEFSDSEAIAGYRLRKEMMDARCFRLIYAELHFDRNRRELSREIEGGEFLSPEEFERLTATTMETE